ncbi:hypothetical protein [Xanthomonas translucens]|nr:hypothetical protein [Xanthomonas translucens]AKK69133.1 hypothetical protein FD63_17445 [Xanthomonas translucens pv. undulosa]AVY68088.1 hypothetical protein NZ30_17690 [Xanthomonas translucens pv. undulosa]ELQ16503.1 hypothetical protein A989_01600 [Xanthomonas translucens DAR61454]KWV14829.1 hypothetical protein ATB53_03470 [Xanthomonas translucens]MBC3972977.1 hypothetical protein [Xanthomonas translucens pv. undulosa]
MPASKPPPWKKPKPRGQRAQPLSPAQKAAARQRAEDNGRPYPNLIDNMWAVRQPRADGVADAAGEE